MRVYNYIVEEVTRQGHDVGALEGQLRCFWMWRAWEEARDLGGLRTGRPPSLGDVIRLGQLVEPEKNAGGFRTVGVRVGVRHCPSPDVVVPQLARLLVCIPIDVDIHTAEQWYKEFELIHPFVDGNGRVGKILLAWMCGTFDRPEFPPADLFGEPIINP